MAKQARSYWGVLPGEIVHAKNLTIAAKYLYVILSSMAYEKGFCWPENETLAGEMQLSKRRVVELLGMLRDSGFIKIMFKQAGKTERRYIYCGMFPDRVDTVPEDAGEDAPEGCEIPQEGREIPQEGDAEDSTPPCENSHTPMREIRFAIKEEKQKEKQKETPPLPPTGGKETKKPKNRFALQEDAKPLLRAYAGEDEELRQALGEFVRIRQDLRAINSRQGISNLLRELERLSGGDRTLKLQLIRQSCANSWKSVFPLRNSRDAPAAGGPPDPEVCNGLR